MGNTDIVAAPLSDANEKNTTEHSTIFDDVFRTIAQKMPQLLIPLINEVFHTSYSEEEPFEQLRNEHYEKFGTVVTDSIVRKLEELKKQGHKLLIDDFGMGHTSLLYLQSEYFDVVKLDGSLTRPLLKSHTNQKIVRSIIELGQELGVKVIAEFVENREQRDLLDTLGCHCYQGYLYAKPLELEAFITYMKQMNEK